MEEYDEKEAFGIFLGSLLFGFTPRSLFFGGSLGVEDGVPDGRGCLFLFCREKPGQIYCSNRFSLFW